MFSSGSQLGSSQSLLSRQLANTGLLSGGVITSTGGSFPTTSLDISALSGTVADYTDPTDPIIHSIVMADQTFVPSAGQLSVDGIFIIGFDKDSVLQVFTFGTLTQTDRVENVLVGSFSVLSNVIISVTVAPLNLAYDGIASSHAFLRDVIGPANVDGNMFSEGTLLNIQNTTGNTFILANNFRQSTISPDIMNIPANNPTGFFRVFRQGTGFSLDTDTPSGTVDINPDEFDDGSGTLATVSNNKFTIQVIYITPDGNFLVAYGQTEYNTFALGNTAILNNDIGDIEFPTLAASVRRTLLLIQQGTTNIATAVGAGTAKFYQEPRFRLAGISA